MSNPFKQIKEEVHLTTTEKMRMRNSLLLEMQKNSRKATSLVQKNTTTVHTKPIQSPFSVSSKYFFSGVAALAAIIFVVTNITGQQVSIGGASARLSSGSTVAMNSTTSFSGESTLDVLESVKSQVDTPKFNQESPSSKFFTKEVATVASGPSTTTSISSTSASLSSVTTAANFSLAPQVIMKFKSGNEYLKQYVPVCFTGGVITCYPGKADLHEMIYLGNNYYTTYSAGDSFSFVTFVEAYATKSDDELLNSYYEKGVQRSFKEATSAGYECNQIASSIEELKAIVASDSIGKCQRLW